MTFIPASRRGAYCHVFVKSKREIILTLPPCKSEEYSFIFLYFLLDIFCFISIIRFI